MKALVSLILLLFGVAYAQAQPHGYLQADSAQFRVFFRPEDQGTYRALWSHLRASLPRIEFSLGIPLQDTVTYIITPNREEWRRITGGIPDWAQGISDPYYRVTILKSPRFGDPMHPFYVTAVHELVHLLLHGSHPDAYIPRWLDEGLAQILSGESLHLRTGLISQAVLSNRLHNFYQIESIMSMPAQEAHLAYAESVTAVDLLIRSYGWSGVRNYANALGAGLEPDEAFIKTFGIHLGKFEGQWFDYLHKTYRFSFFQSWEFYLGILFLPFLALAGFFAWRRRRRILAQWEEEERARTLGSMSEDYPPPEDSV
ncbi:MAG: peptidase MA family metallohydrolase [bacterium]